jgi:hypothetical protein
MVIFQKMYCFKKAGFIVNVGVFFSVENCETLGR